MFDCYMKYMFCIGIIGQLVFYSQFYKIITTKSARNVPLFGFLCGLLAASSWMVYGFIIRDTPIKFSSIIGTVGALLTVASIVYYRNK